MQTSIAEPPDHGITAVELLVETGLAARRAPPDDSSSKEA
jgi:hypothetical protein